MAYFIIKSSTSSTSAGDIRRASVFERLGPRINSTINTRRYKAAFLQRVRLLLAAAEELVTSRWKAWIPLRYQAPQCSPSYDAHMTCQLVEDESRDELRRASVAAAWKGPFESIPPKSVLLQGTRQLTEGVSLQKPDLTQAP
ncbi:hypothetical protein PGT21_029489 [Puccinia graminis f. sp. tritici]|uniref:Uncharacterized protein n=1 Tax=Puccinia graminis f. sp. tritici TaxID=56615 RepID=A0A5B0P3S3_PUCGR|nr:hypothetical protein PGT21_029489 [Puccinia graminis f. sp. tritici]KAA1121539.1 hypothetical protein PGTUg99_031461 [Puccinia graminis f. sp. tritici]